MRQVFISYSSKDFSQAQAVRNVLEQNGITCWMAPADIPGGSNYTKEIPIAIKGCQAFVLMLSDNAQHSPWVLKELDSAVNAGKIILPFQIEDVPLSDEFNFLLTGAQRYAAYQRKSDAMKNLVSRIKAIIQADQSAPEAQPEPAPEPKKQTVDQIFGQHFGGKAPKKETPRRASAFTLNRQADTGKKKQTAQKVQGQTCPACGGTDILLRPNAIRPVRLSEWLWMALAGFLAYLGLSIGLSILAVILIEDEEWALIGVIAMIVLPFLAWIFGKHLATERIRRQRLRSRIQVTEYRCAACKKKFRAVVADDKTVQA